MKKLMVLMAMVAVLALMAVPAYADPTGQVVVTVNVSGWVEIWVDKTIQLDITAWHSTPEIGVGIAVTTNTAWKIETVRISGDGYSNVHVDDVVIFQWWK